MIILHRAVDSTTPNRSIYDLFNAPNVVVESHFFVFNNGTIEQYMDTGVQADANRLANPFAVSIETEDDGVEKPWTAEQVEAIVRLVDWLCTTHNIPRRQCDRWDGSGIGWHVMFGAPGPWTPVAKICPGPNRIGQTKNVIIPRVAAGNPIITATTQETDDMFTVFAHKADGDSEAYYSHSALVFTSGRVVDISADKIARASVQKLINAGKSIEVIKCGQSTWDALTDLATAA